MPPWHDANIQVINNKKTSQCNISTGKKPLAQGETKPVGNKCNNGKNGKKREKEEGKAVNQHQRDLNWKKCYQKDRFKEFKNIFREDLEGTSVKKESDSDIELTHHLYDLIARTNEALRMLQPEIMSIHKTARDLF